MRYLIFLLVALSVSNRSYADVIDKANVDENKHITDLQNCHPSRYEQTREIAGQKVSLSWEVKGVEDENCRLHIKNSSDGILDCLVPLDELATVLSENSDINMDDYCHAIKTQQSIEFQDINGVIYDCDTKLNVQMVSVEECSRCPNRELVEDGKIKLGQNKLTYCVLSQCPAGYRKSPEGLCKVDKVLSEEQTPMKQYFIDNKSDKLIVFFAGWGCDEHQFANLKDRNYDVLVLYDYNGLGVDFDFSKYQEVEVIGYSAGVFVASIIADRIPNLKHKIALNGNPYLFDEKKGLSAEIVNTFKQITMDNYLDFRREYMVDSDEEFELYNQLQSERSLESCQSELQKLQEFYQRYAEEINPVFDKAIISEHDKIFNFQAQQDFYGDKLYVLPETKHHVFFKFNSFEDILKYN